MIALLRYHVRRVYRPALWFVMGALLLFLIYTYRAGGAWMGQAFGYRTVLQFWNVLTTVFVLFLALISPPPRASHVESDPLYLARPSLRRVLLDRLVRLVVLLSPLLLVGVAASLYMMTRVPDAANMVYPESFPDPLSVGAIWRVLLLGPVPGVALLLALGEGLGTLLWNNVLRVAFIGVALIMDAINRLTSPWLSPSGTALGIQQTRTNLLQSCEPVLDPEWWDREFCTLQAMWGDYLFAVNGGQLIGPVTAEPAPELVVARLTLGLLAVLVTVGTAWWYHRHLRLSPDE